YVSTDGGPFTLWRDDVVDASAAWNGRVKSRYSFKVVATDALGNVGPESAVMTTMVAAPASYTLKRNGANVDVIGPRRRVVASRPMDAPGPLWLQGSDKTKESYTLDLSAGALPTPVAFELAAGKGAG